MAGRTRSATDRPRTPRRAAGVSLLALLLAAVVGCSASDPTPVPAPVDLAQAAAEEDSPSVAAAPEESPEPLVTAEPDQYSEVGDLVDGFPIELLPVPGDAVILVTSAVPVGDADVQEVSLNLRTSATAEDLLTLYRTALTEAGFTEIAAQAPDTDLAVDVTFVRSGGDELVSIGVLDTDGARTVTIGGRIRT